MVSSYRQPRGFIEEAEEVQPVRTYSRTEASVSYVAVQGWRALGFNGKKGKRVMATRKAAALELLSRGDLQGKP